MSKHLLRGSLGLALSALLMLSALPATAMAAEEENTDFTLIELIATDVTLDETEFEYTGSEIKPNVTVRVKDTLLTLDQDYTLEYADNVEVGEAKVIVTGIATASETRGYTGTVEVPFYINEKAPEEPEFTLVEIKGTDVTINGTEFDYTGQPIEPAVTVTIDGKTLTPGQDYAIEYVNNLVPGTGTVIVRGIATASETLGYTGEVRMNFTIKAIPQEEAPGETPEETPDQTPEEEYPLVEIQHSDVTINGKEFIYTGKAIEPKITVTVDGKVLTAGRDYSVRFENNVNVGTATAIISGIATATETGGYTGEVKIDFSILPNYQITKGSGAKWFTECTKNLSFTASGAHEDFTGVSVDGKRLDTSYYTVKNGTVVTLKNSFLKKLALGSHTITVHFADGDAEGTFRVVEGLDPTNPQTGDAFPLRALASVMFVSLTGLIGMGYAFRKKIWK